MPNIVSPVHCSVLVQLLLFGVVRSGKVALCRTEPAEVAPCVNGMSVFIRKSNSRQVNGLVADLAKRRGIVIEHNTALQEISLAAVYLRPKTEE